VPVLEEATDRNPLDMSERHPYNRSLRSR